jgi:hypothetical protein
VFILKGVKVLCFDAVLQVLILKGLSGAGCWRVCKQRFGRAKGPARGAVPIRVPSSIGAARDMEASDSEAGRSIAGKYGLVKCFAGNRRN